MWKKINLFKAMGGLLVLISNTGRDATRIRTNMLVFARILFKWVKISSDLIMFLKLCPILSFQIIHANSGFMTVFNFNFSWPTEITNLKTVCEIFGFSGHWSRLFPPFFFLFFFLPLFFYVKNYYSIFSNPFYIQWNKW